MFRIDLDPLSTGLNHRRYALSNHLGNVLVTLSDGSANVLSYSDYYPFGAKIADRSWNREGYRYGFNGKENDTDLNGSQLIQDYGFRVYNPVIGKFLSVDPLMKSYPRFTPYQFAGNSPIFFLDIDGREIYPSSKLNSVYKQSYVNSIKLLSQSEIFSKVYKQVNDSDIMFEVSSFSLSDPADYKAYTSGQFNGFLRVVQDITNDYFFFETITKRGSEFNPHHIKFRPEMKVKGETFSQTSTVFEEIFHAGQLLFYGDQKSKPIFRETEAKVAKAFVYFLNGGYLEDPKYNPENKNPKQIKGWKMQYAYVFSTYDGVTDYFNALKNGDEISGDLEQRFKDSVKKLAKEEVTNVYKFSQEELDTYDGSTDYFDSLNKK
ncbi:RHS repeat domain-containing protein [Flammeovirga aprica]|uniref:RHS repeat-associated core domain-containing protein n=1 Tax=Flammeovirga aprica JL-4 TaxID=694437 RepID=A0A7X9RYX5_9BACT|nr:RHS repeat-associated core domain-containing protein [Flammeovirga aprica]NME71271.1 hypothetical protein [Flammeovirga aprica JL-4]